MYLNDSASSEWDERSWDGSVNESISKLHFKNIYKISDFLVGHQSTPKSAEAIIQQLTSIPIKVVEIRKHGPRVL